MKIEFYLKESLNGDVYEVDIKSLDGEVFIVTEDGTHNSTYHSKEEFLEDFPELESWFSND